MGTDDGSTAYALLVKCRTALVESQGRIPREPTEAMTEVGMEKSVLGRASVDDDSYVLSIWRAMYDAAIPEKPSERDGDAIREALKDAIAEYEHHIGGQTSHSMKWRAAISASNEPGDGK